MARRKSDAEVGAFGVWAYNARDALDLSVEAAVALLPTTYHPATLRKVEGGSARPGTRMWRELGNLYGRLATERGMDLEPQPRLRPESLETTETPDTLISALMAQTRAISDLAATIQAALGLADLRPDSPEVAEARRIIREDFLRARLIDEAVASGAAEGRRRADVDPEQRAPSPRRHPREAGAGRG